MTGHLHGKKVALDMGALQALCHECMTAINAPQNRVVHEECDSGMSVDSHLPLAQSFESQVALSKRYFAESCV